MVKVYVWSVVLYGSETWTLGSVQELNLVALHTEPPKVWNCSPKTGRTAYPEWFDINPLHSGVVFSLLRH